MPDKEYFTDDVYGIARDLPLNYVVRQNVDGELIDTLSRRMHIVIHGSSKQGKTSVRKYNLPESDYIVVQCSNKWGLGDLGAAVLKKAGFSVVQAETRTVTGRAKISVEVGSVAAGAESSESVAVTRTALELDAEDPNDIIRALDSIQFNRLIVLEDFHYLEAAAQRDFAVALKSYHENSSLCFIVVGVWLEKNRLLVYNGDLTGRVHAIDADEWTEQELLQVIAAGERFLRVRFDDSFRQLVVKRSERSVYVVQEACRRACRRSGVTRTMSVETPIGEGEDVDALVKEIVDEQSARYTSFIQNFAEGFQDTQLQMYRWILYPILTAPIEELRAGLMYANIRKTLQRTHPERDSLNPGNITQSLQSVAGLQVKKDIKPLILDYDTTNRRLNVVDKAFLLWRQHQSTDELLEHAGLPLSETAST